MARAQPTCLGNVNDPKNLTRHSERLAKVLNGNVSYGATMQNGQEDINMSVWKAFGTSPGAANTDFTIKHSLGRTPITIVGQDTKDGSVLYRSPVTAWTATTVTLRSTGASSVYNLVVA
jgi:hypothetical protein